MSELTKLKEEIARWEHLFNNARDPEFHCEKCPASRSLKDKCDPTLNTTCRAVAFKWAKTGEAKGQITHSYDLDEHTTVLTPESYFPFGMYAKKESRKTVAQVKAENPQYIKWFMENVDKYLFTKAVTDGLEEAIDLHRGIEEDFFDMPDWK